MDIRKIEALARKARVSNQGVSNLQVNDMAVIDYDPFGVHTTRHALVLERVSKGYKVRFTSTKGASCDGCNRKVYQRKDGTYVTLTECVEVVTYKQVLRKA